MYSLDIFVKNFQIFLLIFARISGLFFMAPFFGSVMIPVRVRIIFSVFIAIILYPVLTKFNPEIPETIGEYGLMLILQIIIGLLMGFLASTVIGAFQLAARFYSFQIGFGVVEVIDPMARVEMPVIGQFKYLLALFIFLITKGHHLLLIALYRSFEILPGFSLTDVKKSEFLTYSLGKALTAMFALALKIAFPILATLFIVSLILGLLAKASPQMNVFMVGFPLEIGIGLIAIILSLPLIGNIAGKMGEFIYKNLLNLLYLVAKR